MSNTSETRMDKIFVDTNILIDFAHKKNKILYKLLETQKQDRLELFINPVVLAEYFADQNLTDRRKLEGAYELVSFFNIVEINTKIGILAGQFMRERKTYALGDTLVAATCINNSLKLVTRNKKHFKNIPGLQFYK